MKGTFEAIYESGVLKPLQPITWLEEGTRVILTIELIERESIVDKQRRERLMLQPEEFSDLANNREHDLFEA